VSNSQVQKIAEENKRTDIYNMHMHRMRRNVFVVSVSALALAPLVIFAWTGPTASPPNGNVAAPVNVGTPDQVKDGGLGVNALTVFGNSLLGGSTGSNAYLNFGATGGTNGYGIRDNAGLLEFKNSGGNWASIQNIVWTLVGTSTSPWATSGNNIYNTNIGNVGIGTANPVARVQIGNMLTLQDTLGGQTSYGWNIYRPDVGMNWIYINSGPAAAIRMNGYDAANPIFQASHWGISFHVNPLGGSAGQIDPTMDTSDVKMVIREDGNIGIGTVSPSAKLHVVGGLTHLQPSSASPGQGLQIDTAGLPNGSSNGILVSAPAGWTGNFMSANLGGVQQFAIAQNGNVSLSNQLYARNLNNSAGTYAVCWSAGTGQLTTAYACSSSDARLKTDVRDFEGGLPKVEALRPVTFEWKDKSRGEGNQSGSSRRKWRKSLRKSSRPTVQE
jgi:Chaperone of endosialidase